ncbi:MAG: hypothetical protein C0506_13005 [Anaerolinea sp.]|nr:hypothetical protein [Anaerolinea sp.]
MRRLATLSILLLPLLAVSCSQESSATPATQPQTITVVPALASDGNTTPSAGVSLSRQGCEVKPTPPGDSGSLKDRQGPYYHQVVLARSTDGVTVTGDKQVLEHASVPDGVQLADGSVYIYYINGARHGIDVALVQGDGVKELGPIWLDGVERPMGVVDPDATLLPDGKVRLVYFSGFGSPSQASRTATMCLADSEDGIHFTVLGRAIAFNEITTDPSIARLADGSWLMAVSQGQKTVLARSSDGLTFEQYSAVTYGGVPEISALSDGRVRLYVCARGIESYISTDKGNTWQFEATVVRGQPPKPLRCDASVVPGANLFIYKWAD